MSFFYRHNIYLHIFVLSGFCFTGNIFSRTFPVHFLIFLKFQNISRTWKMNLLFSKFPRTHGDPVSSLIAVSVVFQTSSKNYSITDWMEVTDNEWIFCVNSSINNDKNNTPGKWDNRMKHSTEMEITGIWTLTWNSAALCANKCTVWEP